jgi:D-serine deaminase-like pyridoxal phosphate-dependent protein
VEELHMSDTGDLQRPAVPTPTMVLPDGIDTPRALVDLEVLERNIASMAATMNARGVGLRPHTKTSKCIEIIRRQVDAGVVGLTVATLGEAEVLAAAGFHTLFQAYPLWADRADRGDRVRRLLEQCDLMVGVESVDGAVALGRAAAGAARPLGVLLELDPGLHRTGVLLDDLLDVASAADRAGLDVRGAFTFGGHGYASCDAPAAAGDDEVSVLTRGRDVLLGAGFDVRVLSAGCTPTARFSARPPVTDERPGTYVFQDCQQVALGSAEPDAVALIVAATVVASHHDGRFVLDAGSKVLAADRPVWLPGHGFVAEYPDAIIKSLSEHHAVAWTTGARPKVGEVVRVVPNHSCVVVNLTDRLPVVRNGVIVDEWAVASRGRNN